MFLGGWANSHSATKQETECKMGMQGFNCIEVSRVCPPQEVLKVN